MTSRAQLQVPFVSRCPAERHEKGRHHYFYDSALVGIGAAIAALIAFAGMIDSFLAATDRGDREIAGSGPERVEVTLSSFSIEGSAQVQALLDSPAVGAAEAGVRLGGSLRRGGKQIDVQIDSIRPDSVIWTPAMVEGRITPGARGIYISELAAADLRVGPSDTVSLRHPRVGQDGSVAFVEDDLPILGVHPHPYRFVAYINWDQAGLFGVPGLTNIISATPAEGTSVDDLKRTLFGFQNVASVQRVGALADAIRDLLGQFVIILRVVEGVMLLIAFLIALNASGINIDERRREHATMFAFGVPVRTVLRMAMVENLTLGVVATVLESPAAGCSST